MRAWSFLLAICWSITASAAPDTVVVIYPDVPAPYHKIFEQIIDGIESNTQLKIVHYQLQGEVDPSQLKDQLLKNNAKACIALGRQGLNIAQTLDLAIPVIIGATVVQSHTDISHLSGISLSPDPYVMFSRLKALAPRTKTIHVTYNPEHKPDLINRAKKAAITYGFHLSAHKTTSLRESAPIYRDIINNLDATKEAIWLPLDRDSVDEKIILPMVLKQAWKKRIIVFSSKPTHAKNGVLFSFYPNNKALGSELIKSIHNKLKTNAKNNNEIVPNKDLFTAANVRTAQRLNLVFSNRQRKMLDLVFPRQ